MTRKCLIQGTKGSSKESETCIFSDLLSFKLKQSMMFESVLVGIHFCERKKV